jgi:hypothetical protein
MGRRSLLVALLLAAALSVTAAASAAPSRAQFIQRGDALCRDVAVELAPLRIRAQSAKTLPVSEQWPETTRIWTAQVAIQKRFNSRLRAIGVPAGDRAAAAIVSGIDRGVVLARRVRDGFAARDTIALNAALPAYVSFTLALNRRVAAYGFRSCGRS